MDQGGEWSGFNVVCVNEEADFMAQLFRNPNEVDDGHGHHDSNNNYHMHNANNNGNNNDEGGVYYSCDSTSNSQNFYYYSQESSYRSSQEGNNYSSYVNDHHRRHHQHALARASSNDSSLPFDFLQCHVNDDNGVSVEMGGCKVEESSIDPIDQVIAEDKHSDSSDNSKKRARVSDVNHIPKGKRNVKAKKSHKLASGGDDEEENEAGGVNGQSCSTGSLDDDCSSKGTANAPSSSGKTRASRGSATDPQSLYARKRRERINERLRILQSLVPNGTKVDISTMLEEAVQYVKFLQLQIKLLSSDDMWMYAPIAYNGMNIGLDFNINIPR